MKRVVVSGVGLVSPLGENLRSVGEWIDSPLSALAEEKFVEKSGMVRKVLVARSNLAYDSTNRLGIVHEDRSVRMAIEATQNALEDANLASDDCAGIRRSMSITVGAGVGPVHALEEAFTNWRAENVRTYPLTVVRGLHNGIAAELSIRYGIQGPARTFAMACASSGVAIASAVRDIRAGAVRAVVVCGADAPLTRPMIDAWLAMRIYASESASGEAASCVPFSRFRNGLALSESAATLVIEDLESARARGHQPIAEILGCGESNDATHLTNPSREGQVIAMQMALRDAAIPHNAVAYINAHATGTVTGDVVEAESIACVFPDSPMVSSTKALHGHALGAAGTLEAIVVIAALRSGRVPPTLGLNDIDPKCSGIRHVLGSTCELPAKSACLTNSFAFGGHNVSIILRAL
jgi:3-oxoacyl-(acyl-carrier-protein) synthase